MSKVALLIGVSRYPPGLNPLPKALKDVEVMRRALRQSKPGFEPVEAIVDRPRQEMQEAIETFFKNRTADDQTIFLFSGYLMQDSDGALYFATPETAPDQQGRLIQAKTIPASFIKEAMNRSPAKQQIFILDSYIRLTFGNRSVDSEPAINLQEQLGGEGRIILTASVKPQYLSEPQDLDVWSYSRYLAAGLETAAADINSNGSITIDEWHNYACRKLQIAAPAMQPQQFGDPKTTEHFLLPVPTLEPHISYRKVLEEKLERNEEVDLAGGSLLSGRTFLNDLRRSLGLSPDEAAEIEYETLHPVRDYRQRLQAYQEQFSGITQRRDVANHQIQSHLKQIQQALGLTEADTQPIHAAPRMVEHQRQLKQYQQQLGQYGQLLINTMQHPFPLADSDRELLERLPQKLQIQEEDANAMQTQLLSQMDLQQPVVEPAVKPDDRASTPLRRPPIVNSQPTTLQPPTYPSIPGPFPPPSPSPVSPSPPNIPPPPLQEQNVSYTPSIPQPPPEGLTSPGDVMPRQQVTPISSPSPLPERSPMRTSASKDSKARSYTALIIPALLLAVLAGTLAALWSSNLLGNSPPNIDTSQTGNAKPINTAATRINLGYTAQTERLFDDAVRYASEAIQLLSPECSASNPSSGATGGGTNACQYLARAYSNRSHAYFDQQNFGRALSDAQQAVRLDPKLVEAHINLANAQFKRGDRTAALQSYTQALQMSTSNQLKAGIYNNRGNIYFAQGDIQRAIQDYNEALKLRTTYADAYFNRGTARAAIKDINNAISDFQMAAQYYTKDGALKLAEQANSKAQSLQPQAPKKTTSTSSA